ncbi:hypothetical protein CDL15_Pgr024653 [Punica granatum]|uniref:Uncharacterized protein n=1 Tax=Punica granatum TaxID=22663 RepID=A0A218WUK5_PUNGR|nr:hypothetical protein CDL15_Pgr024653 [Punica granatum]
MLTLHNASLLKAQCGIVGMNHTTHLDPSSSALRVSDALFISLEAQSQQTEIAVISGSPKKLRKQSEKSSFGLLGHLRLHICIYRLKGLVPTSFRAFRVKNRHSRVNSASRALASALAHVPRAPRACPHAQPCARAPARAPDASHAPPVHSSRTPRAPSSPKVHALATEHSFKRSTESPDSRTLPRLFPRIPRLGKSLLT